MALPFLLEIGAEEIPDWMIEPALADMKQRFERVCVEQKLGGSVSWVDATPRRLVLRADGLCARQEDQSETVLGPAKKAGSGAAQGFARKMGVTVDQLETTTNEKGDYFSFRRLVKGRAAAEILWESLPELITSIYFPKTMYWTGKGGVRFIRPIRWIVALLGDNVVPFEVAGVESGRTTSGHRILGSPASIEVTIDNYTQRLRENYVIVSAAERRERIAAALGTDVERDDALLATLTYLTEYPTPIRGTFDALYLELPKEILSTVMRHHQRYFSVVKPDGSLDAQFVAVTNTDGDPDGLIRKGNERVLRARFNDARFFWQVDQQKRLEERIEDLAKVTFQAKLEDPTYKHKTSRMMALSLFVSRAIGADSPKLMQAAALSKTDLTTEMVKEFTELQGVVGGLYARAQGVPEEVAIAIYDHYKPVSMDDTIPRTLEGQALSLIDKVDTLVECFHVGLIPSGSKDPFALRRAAQGVIRILFEARLPLDLFEFLREAAKESVLEPHEQPALVEFFRERISYYLRDVKGFPYDEVNAVLAVQFATLADLSDRVKAIHEVRASPDFEPLAASFKRIKNILKQAQAGELPPVDESLLISGPETDLYRGFERVRTELAAGFDYTVKLQSIASLRPQVDLFFDKILVNDPDPAIRQNRLALLESLLTEFSTIADFSEIVTQGAGAQS